MHNAKFFLKYKLQYPIVWLLFFGLWHFFRHDDYANEATAFKVTLIKMLDLTLVVCITNFILIPQLLYKRKYQWFAASFIFLVLFSSIIKMNILAYTTNTPGLFVSSMDWKARIYDNIIPHFFLAVAGAAFKLIYDYSRMQLRMSEMAKEKAEAELNFLKSQINPHFLFNSLNSVYFLIDKQNDEARDALHKFSDMLRYQLYEMNGDQVSIEKEVEYLRGYVDLQKLRSSEQYKVSFMCDESLRDFSIAPLLLIPFVENAFKHISHFNSKLNSVSLEMKKENGRFHFSIENSKEENNASTNKASGIGLKNVKRRLELLYAGKHECSIIDEADRYKVNLSISV